MSRAPLLLDSSNVVSVIISFNCQQPRTTQEEKLKEELSKLGQHVGMSVGYIVLFTLIEMVRVTHVGVTLPCLGRGVCKDREGGARHKEAHVR